jgi:hypothetical protein
MNWGETKMEVSGKLCEKENVTELCEPCTVENLSNQADGFCEDCNEFMCQRCFGYHLRGKSCRNHVLDPISGSQFQRKLRTREEKCKTHTSESVKYYCSVHDFIGCGDCIVSNHRTCEPEFIRDLALNLEASSEFKSMISKLQNSDVEKVESETRIARYRKENNMLVAKALRDIKEFRRDIECWLDKMETYIKTEVRKISDDNEKSFSQLQQKVVEISDDIDRINQLLDSNIHHGENLFIRMIECKPEVGIIDKTLSEIKSKLVFQRYKFERGEDMKEMLKSSDKLGSIKVITKTEKKQFNELSTEDINMPPLAEGSCHRTGKIPSLSCVCMI